MDQDYWLKLQSIVYEINMNIFANLTYRCVRETDPRTAYREEGTLYRKTENRISLRDTNYKLMNPGTPPITDPNVLNSLNDEWFESNADWICRIIWFNLESSKLLFVPSSIKYFKALQKLDVQRNRIRRLPNEMGQLTYLVTLNVDNNRKLCDLPSSMQMLKELRHVKYAGTRIKKPCPVLPKTTFFDLL